MMNVMKRVLLFGVVLVVGLELAGCTTAPSPQSYLFLHQGQ